MFLKKRIFKVSFNKTYQSQLNRSRNLKKDKTKRFFETKNNKFQKFHLTIQCQSEAESYKRDKRNVNITFFQKKTKNKKKVSKRNFTDPGGPMPKQRLLPTKKKFRSFSSKLTRPTNLPNGNREETYKKKMKC